LGKFRFDQLKLLLADHPEDYLRQFHVASGWSAVWQPMIERGLDQESEFEDLSCILESEEAVKWNSSPCVVRSPEVLPDAMREF
jgi:hypothetical protein